MPLSNATSKSAEASVSSENRDDGGSIQQQQQKQQSSISSGPSAAGAIAGKPPPAKKKRNLPGMPDPEAEVVALSPKTLMATNRFVCEICGKGFQRDQNLQLHRRGHNLPWKLRQRTSKEPRKRVFICPELSCVHHDPSRALGDLTGIKKHFCRKHGEKKWKCNKCNKRYAVQSDWKAHSKTCGTREYRCDCGTLFSRRDSFITHRAFCDALAEESARFSASKDGAAQQLPCGSHKGTVASTGAQLPAIGVLSQSHGTFSMRMPAGTGEILGVGLKDDHEVLPWLAPIWAQGNAGGGLGMPPAAPKHSVLLGPGGPGPGPPVGRHNMVGRSQLQAADAMQLNEPGSSYLMHPTKAFNSGPGMPTNHYGPFDTDINAVHLPLSQNAGNLPSNPFARGFRIPGLPGSSLRQGVASGDLHVAGISNILASQNRTNRRSNTGPHFYSASASFPAGSCNGSGSFASASSTLNQQSHAPISQMSATALLQKAAQMGATASDTSLLRGFGMTGLESGSVGCSAFWQGSRQDQARGTDILSSESGHQQVMMRPGEADFPGDTNPTISPKFEVSSRLSGNDTLNSMPGLFGGSFPSIDSTSQFDGESDNIWPMLVSRSTTYIPKKTSAEDDGATHTNNTFYGKDSHSIAAMVPNLGLFPKFEEGDDKQTRDFLGVSVASSISGPFTRIENSLAHCELGGCTTSIGATEKVSPFSIPRSETMMGKATGIVNCNVPERSWNC
ncbi:hypothetical protein O6H91_09G043400 [Diphasiastrum complanatum]|uniref:Uncharacterized protein n=1 Tax=Diphasiastrum complanatum TaxID=34168 RepID=A0ACC2CNH4_DIPCM|nr:hypothetical protein O6H91_09G043400 [Diphasiastrum complanatum]